LSSIHLIHATTGHATDGEERERRRLISIEENDPLSNEASARGSMLMLKHVVF